VQVPFVVREAGQLEGPFFLGHAREGLLSAEQVRQLVEQGTLRCLSFAYSIRDDQSLWITPEEEIWLASATAPINDNARILLDAQELRTPTRTPQGVMDTLTARDIVRTRTPEGRMYFEPESYIKKPHYRAFAEKTRATFRGIIGADNERPKSGIEHWDSLASAMLHNAIEFCESPMLKYGYRQQLIDVVQIGILRTFTLLAVDRSHPAKILENAKSTFNDKITALHNHIERLEVGMLSQTVATAYAEAHLGKGFSVIPTENKISISELAAWCADRDDRRVIVCDHGIATDIVSLAASNDDIHKSFRHHGFDCRYPIDVPVGFMHPAGDLRWRKDIEHAVRQVLLEQWDNNPWDEVRNELDAVSIEGFDLQTMCHRFGLDDEYDKRKRASLRADQGA
jgi:hypothetical protein